MTRKTPTLKQKKLVHEYIRTGNKTQSGLTASDIKKPAQAYDWANKALKKPYVQTYIAKVLEDSGLSDRQLSDRLKRIVRAGSTRTSLKQATPSDSLRGIEMAFKLLDRFPAERKQIEKRELRLKLEARDPKELQAMLAKLVDEGSKYQKLLEVST